MKELDDLQEAEKAYRKDIKLKPDFANAHLNLGHIFEYFGNFADAINQYKKAIKFNNELSLAKTALITTKGSICDWSD